MFVNREADIGWSRCALAHLEWEGRRTEGEGELACWDGIGWDVHGWCVEIFFDWGCLWLKATIHSILEVE